MKFWSKRVLWGALLFPALTIIGIIVEMAQGTKMTISSAKLFMTVAVVLFGFGYLLGMVWEHKVGFEQGSYSGKQYGLGVLIGLGVCIFCGAAGWAITNLT